MAYVAFLQSLLQKSGNDSKQPSPISRISSVVELPEILEIILAFVDQETLLNTTRLVCRSWYAISKRFLRRELIFEWPLVLGPPPPPVPQSLVKALWQKGVSVFDPPVYPRKRGGSPVFEGLVELDPTWLSRLPRATALRIVNKMIALNAIENKAVWRAIREALEALGRQYPHQNCRRGLEELWIDSKAERIVLDNLWPWLPSATLTSLYIEACAVSKCVALETLLKWLPNLNTLFYSSTSGAPFLSSIGNQSISDPTQSQAGDTFFPEVFKVTKLQSITFINIPILEDDLRELVDRSPHLKQLKFIHVDIIPLQSWSHSKPRSSYASTSAQRQIRPWVRLLTDYPHLKDVMSLRLSVSSPTFRAQEMMTLWNSNKGNDLHIDSETSLFESLATELGGLANAQEDCKIETKVLLAPPPALYPVINHLTALTLRAVSVVRVGPLGSILHQLLCSAPALQHLCAKGFRFAVEDLDVYGQYYAETKARRAEASQQSMTSLSPATGSCQTSSSAVSKVWACRGLLTLQLSFYSRSGTSKKTSMTSFENPVNARVVFGYLSRITPLLSDLSVSIGACSFGLEYGFCLLSRLRHLEVLVLWLLCAQVKSPLQPLDLAWMTVGGLSTERETEGHRQVAPNSLLSNDADNICQGSENMSMVGSLEDVYEEYRSDIDPEVHLKQPKYLQSSQV